MIAFLPCGRRQRKLEVADDAVVYETRFPSPPGPPADLQELQSELPEMQRTLLVIIALAMALWSYFPRALGAEKEKVNTSATTWNLRLCAGLDLIEREKRNPANVVIPIGRCALEGFVSEGHQYREESVQLVAAPKGRIVATVPKAGRWHVGFIFYDTPGDERFAVRIGGKHRATMVADLDNSREYLFVVEQPLDLAEGDKIELETLVTDPGPYPNPYEGRYRTEALLLLAKLPPAWKRPFEISEALARPLRDTPSPSVGITWITTWATRGRVEYGLTPALGQVAEESVAANCHRIVLAGVRPGTTYHYRILCPRPDGRLVSTPVKSVASTAPRFKGSATRERVALEVLRQRYTRERGLPVSGGVPFPKGALGSPGNVRLLDSNGHEIPAQVCVSGRWPDGSIKWILLDCQPGLPANGPAKLTLEYGAGVSPTTFASPLRVEESTDAITVTTGPLRFEVGKNTFGPFRKVWADADGDGVPADADLVSAAGKWAGSVVTDSNGVEHTSLGPPRQVVIEESGPLKVVIRVRGRHSGPDGQPLFAYDTRIHAYAGKPYVRVHYSFANDNTEHDFTEVRSIELRLPLLKKGKAVSPVGPAEGEAGPVFAQLTADICEIGTGPNRQQKAGRLSGWLASVVDGRAVGVAVRDFWQHYPKSLALGPEGLTIGICPALHKELYEKECLKIGPGGVPENDYLYWYLKTGNYRFKCGCSKRHELLFSFGTADFADDADLLDNPPVLRCAPSWYCGTKVFGAIAGPEQTASPDHDKMFSTALDKYLTRRVRDHLYGMLNFGDWWFGPGADRSWGNIEYDTQQAFLRQWVRGGDLRFFLCGEQAARHNMDVDVVRYHPQARGIGFVYRHDPGHVAGTRVSHGYWTVNNVCHSWTQGLCDYYFLTGDRRSLETARMIADLYNTYKATGFDFKNTRKAGWHLILTIAVYRATADPYYLNAARIILERVLERQTADGAWKMYSFECTPHSRWNSVFCVTLMMTGLKMLHEETGDPRVLDSLMKAADFMKALWVEESKDFRYTSCPNDRRTWSKTFLFDALVYVCRHTRDPRLERCIRLGMATALAQGLPDHGKLLTQQTRAMPYILYEMSRMAKERGE